MIRVLLVDDDALVRSGLSTILGMVDDLEVVGECSDGLEVADAVREKNPDVVLMDIRMPGMDGITATATLTAGENPPRVLVLTTFHLDEYVFGALEAGASGFLLKDTPPREIAEAVRVVAAGQAMLSPADTRKVIERFADRSLDGRRMAALDRLEALSDRERQVAIEVARGASNAEIARGLFLSEATIKAHVSHILTKLDLSNRVQLAIMAHDAGWV